MERGQFTIGHDMKSRQALISNRKLQQSFHEQSTSITSPKFFLTKHLVLAEYCCALSIFKTFWEINIEIEAIL